MNKIIVATGIVSTLIAAFIGSVEITPHHSEALAADIEVIQPLDYKGVTLDDGPLKRQFDEIRDYYLRIPNDDLLKGFRTMAGRPAPGNDLGGWYTEGTFHVFGQIISGLARMYAATGDVRCRDKANYLTDEWAKCIRNDGYFFAGNPNAPHYIYDKMVGGLVDVYLYCNNRQALVHLGRITSWAEKNLDRSNAYGYGYTEWYTLSENLYRAYLASKDIRYSNFAQVWEYTEYWSIYADNGDILDRIPKDPPYFHAYSHINTLAGLGVAYQAKGKSWYLQALKNAYECLHAKHIWPTGGYGPNENLLNRAQMIDTLSSSHHHFETQCGTWAGFKLSRYLMSFTGDAKYGDWIERLLINGIGASIPAAADGKVFYYADYNINGGSKKHFDIKWTCCTGTRPIAAADFHNIIYFKDASTLYVNVYASSTVRWRVNNTGVVLRQRTLFPESRTVDMTLEVERPCKFGIKLRMPGWLNGPAVISVNGKRITSTPDSKHWAEIRRQWKKGDTLSVTLPMKFWKWSADPASGYPAAILYGPVVMAARSESGNPGGRLTNTDLNTALVPNKGEMLTYHPASDPSVLLRPFYAYKEAEPYYIFFGQELSPSHVDISHNDLIYSSGWSVSSIHYSNTAGMSAQYTFQGTAITLNYGKFNDGGQAQVLTDGSLADTIDCYDGGWDIPASWERKGLSSGTHTIKIVVLGQKNPSSAGTYVNVSGLRIWR